jgi:hypothetical protein
MYFEWMDTGGAYAEDLSLYRQSPNFWQFNSVWDNGEGVIKTVTKTHALGDYVTLVFAWEAGQVRGSVDGSAFVSSARVRGGAPAAWKSTFDIGSRSGTSIFQNGDALWFACGTGKLTDADAADIAAISNIDPLFSDFPSNARSSLTAIMPFTTGTYYKTLGA